MASKKQTDQDSMQVANNKVLHLVDKCKKNDPLAQRALYNHFSGKMFALCRRYLTAQDAEDMLVEAFVKVFKKIHQFENKGSFEGWLRRVMVNQCLAYIQKTKAKYLEVDIEEATYSIGKNDDTVASMQAEDLLKLVEELPVGYRTVFNLYAIEGYSHKEIAEKLMISEGTSKSQLSRARVLLQQKVKSLDQDEQKHIQHPS